MKYRKSTAITAAVIAASISISIMTACGSENKSQNNTDVAETTTAVEETLPSGETGQPFTEQGGKQAQERNGNDIGLEAVKSIALAKVPGATAANIVEIERDVDNGRIEYEGSIYYNGYEYEFDIDGATGNILKWEIDD